MDRFTKPRFMPMAARQTQPAAAVVTASKGVGLASIPAAWPNGVSPLAQAVNACQRRDSRDMDWLAHTPNSIVLPSGY